ncbi:unnamed protein product [Lupinus luteus]|uniref:Uncharacterized protein n=1 Tax=Lupinus luteus TaxID=3873 RepID=A0AAV1WS39_LUPLU
MEIRSRHQQKRRTCLSRCTVSVRLSLHKRSSEESVQSEPSMKMGQNGSINSGKSFIDTGFSSVYPETEGVDGT